MKTSVKILMCFSMAATIAVMVSCKKDDIEEAVLTPTAQEGNDVLGAGGQVSQNGTDGADGTDGQNGVDGQDGADGEQGPKGDEGEPGPTGENGQDGAQGPAGPQGEPGADGKDGADGAQGPQGEQGPVGVRGPQGEQGTAGEDGNANVIASEWFEPIESSYGCCNPKSKALVLSNGIKGKVNGGVILVYYDNDLQVQLLPRHTISTSSGTIQKSVDSHINHASNTLYVTIRSYDSDLTLREYTWNPSGPAYGKGVRFKYIIIPEDASSKNNGPNFKKMSYKEVMDHFGLSY